MRRCLRLLPGRRPSPLRLYQQPQISQSLLFPLLRTSIQSASSITTTTTTKMPSTDSKAVFRLEGHSSVPVTAPGLTKEQLEQWSPFKDWISTLSHSLSLQSQPSHPFHKDPYRLKSVTVDSHTMFGKLIGFAKLTADISTANDSSKLPGVIFLRGPAVAMLVILIPDDVEASADADSLDEAYVVLTVQPRIATGSLGFVELPAGMLDGSSNFAGAAAREIEEELGLVIKQEDLVCLTDKAAAIKKARDDKRGASSSGGGNASQETLPYAMYPSAGGCDEYIKIFAHEKRVPRETLHEWEGKYGGLRDEGEMITLKLVPLEDLWLEGGRDSKALAAVTLYQQLKKWERKHKDEKLC